MVEKIDKMTPAMQKRVKQEVEKELRRRRTGIGGVKTLSLKLDQKRYDRLVELRIVTGRSGQDLLLEAFDDLLARYRRPSKA